MLYIRTNSSYMESRFLFHRRFKVLGWALTIPSLFLGIFVQFLDFEFQFLNASWMSGISFYKWSDDNFTNELVMVGLITGLLLLSFSREKIEDEQIVKVRLESLQWSVYINYIILLIAIVLVHGSGFLLVMAYNMFTLLIFFLIRFHYVLYKQSKVVDQEGIL